MWGQIPHHACKKSAGRAGPWVFRASLWIQPRGQVANRSFHMFLHRADGDFKPGGDAQIGHPLETPQYENHPGALRQLQQGLGGVLNAFALQHELLGRGGRLPMRLFVKWLMDVGPSAVPATQAIGEYAIRRLEDISADALTLDRLVAPGESFEHVLDEILGLRIISNPSRKVAPQRATKRIVQRFERR